jgi:nicotinate phosphoribosyltransferase
MRQGRRLANVPVLNTLREHARAEMARLPASLRALTPAAAPYCVTVAPPLKQLAAEVDRRIQK